MNSKQQRITSLAQSLIDQHEDIYVYNFLSFLDMADLAFKYLEQEFHKKVGLDRTKIQILDLLLVKGGKLTPSQLSLGVNRTKITITTALDNLENQGLIKSSRIKKDRRLRMVVITEKGLDVLEKFLPLRQEIFTGAMQCFSHKEAGQFQSLIIRLKENLFKLPDASDFKEIRRFQNYSFINQLTRDNLTKERP